MQLSNIFKKLIAKEIVSFDEALFVYNNASLSQMMFFANLLRKIIIPNSYVSFIIDRNINYTNICFSNCLFCNFCKSQKSLDAYTLCFNDLKPKIDELIVAGGNQILLQGGMNPKLDINYYINLFKEIKKNYPSLKLHALSPSEIVFLAKKEKISIKETIQILQNSGLDSLPGGGAEILSDRVRDIISPHKCNTNEWLNVMHEAHKLNITTSATMMFGHIETIEERIQHLFILRDLQSKKPKSSKGFISFTLWPFASKNTNLIKKYPDIKDVSSYEYIKMLSFSRLILNNINNIQASWLTVGKDVAGLCLYAGANDLSSIMIEENVLSSAGKNYTMNKEDMENLIKEQRFIPKIRNQEYEVIAD